MGGDTIIFYAPFGRNATVDKNGGAESGCKRTLSILNDCGYKVITVDKAVNNGNVAKYLHNTNARIAEVKKLLKANPTAVLHLSGMCGKLLPFELVLVRIAKRSGHKVVYEIRNGDFVMLYDKGSSAYRRMVNSLASLADVFLCQGKPFQSFLGERYGVSSFYYPNYVMDEYVPESLPDRDRSSLRIVFFGRVVPAKNVDFMIDVVAGIRKRGIACRFDVIGAYEDGYFNSLSASVRNAGLENCVTFHGRKPFPEIAKSLSTAHFFLFPSREPREGHSNSLTEAMAYGVVPVSSPAGFSGEVISDDRCVVDDFSVEAYASRILSIWDGDWDEISRNMYDRVKSNYVSSIAKQTLIELYENLF